MGDDSEWIKLPTDEKVIHKVWKARVAGYEEAIKLFPTLDEKSPEFNKFLGSLKKIATDNNAIAQEKGLDAVLAYVENAHVAGRACGEVMSALVTKCLNAARAKTKEKAMEIILMYVEIDKHEIVQEELMKGLENKQPKIVYGCVTAFRFALELFGPKVIQLKPIVKLLPKLLEDRDKTVREETKLLVVEVYRWIGAALRPQLANLKPVQLQELETEFENLPPGKPTQTRFMRSQQDLKVKAEAAAMSAVVSESGDGGQPETAVEIDPLDLVDPVEILSKLPKIFYEQIEAKKWQERKEMLDVLEKLVETPKLLPGDYADLVRAIKKVLSKDTNVMLVAASARCMCGLAKGLRKKFQPYAVQCNEAILVKFKEKKPMVVTALRDAIDAVYRSTNLEAITEDILTALEDKNPNVKAETAAFLARCFTLATPTALNKKILKPLITTLCKTINDTVPEVREPSFTALGTAMKVVGEKAISSFLGDVDSIKMAKIKDCCEKAELINMKGASSAAAAPVQSAKPVARPGLPSKKETAASKSAVKPGGGRPPSGTKSKAVKGGGGVAKGKKGSVSAASHSKPVESLLADEIVEEKAIILFGEENVGKLANPNWKERLAAMESIEQEIKRTPKDDMPTQAVTRIIGCKKPGLKDTNFQVLKLRLTSLMYLAENFNFSETSSGCILSDVIDKIGDAKNGGFAKNLLTAISEGTQFSKISGDVIRIAFEGKNPKTQAESLNWLAQAIYDFGFKLNIKPLIQYLKKALSATNPSVRQSAVTLLGVCYMYMGATLRVLFEDEKPTLLAQIDAEFDKMKGQKPPTPTRGLADALEDENDDMEADGDAPTEDLIPRNDVSEKITDEVLNKLADKNWKIRKEGLDDVTAILNEAKFVSANLGGLPEALKLRLSDSNKILVTTTLGICKTIALSSGQHCKRHVPILAGALISTLGDSKPMIRQAACAALDAWVEQTKLTPFIEDGVFAESLRIENPFLRSTLLEWLCGKLKDQQKKLPAEIKDCIPPLFSCLGDRKPEVRKAAQEAILPFMLHTGYESMLKAASKVDKSSKDTVLAILEKVKQEMPAKPKKVVQSTPVVMAHVAVDDVMEDYAADDVASDSSASKSTKATSAGKTGKTKSASAAKTKPTAASSKKEVPEDTTPLITNSYTKQQRMKDEKALKTLKWNFTQPRGEFVEQLRDQMEKNFSRSILEYLNHTDFQKHIKAIQLLSGALVSHREETICNIDLILRWFTLRFFETNPSMLNKALEYLLQLFQILSDAQYMLTDSEANSFVPYLILKIGEAKDSVRREVRKIIAAVTATYPASKMFLFIMGGLASKNSKQRSECLEELGSMIENFGLGVCQPSPKEALKEIAKQISDRDNSVRSAALNTIVSAYAHVGDQVFKYVGKLNDKDLGMLEERIKRASKTKPPLSAPAVKVASGRPASAGRARPSTAGGNESATTQARSNSSNGTSSGIRPPTVIPEKYRILSEFVNWKRNDVKLLADEQTQEGEELVTPKMRVVTVGNVGNRDALEALEALTEVERELTEEYMYHYDRIVQNSAIQLELIHSKHLLDNSLSKEGVFKLYRVLLAVLFKIIDKKLLKNTPADVFKTLFAQLIRSVIDPRLNDYEEGQEIIKSINWLIVSTLQNSNHTSTLCATIALLTDCVDPASPASEQVTELSLKCLWKKTRMLEEVIKQGVLTFEPVLQLCNVFLVARPSSTWRAHENDKPLRSIKTIISLLLTNAPDKVRSALLNVQLGPNSELELYIKKHQDKCAAKARNGGSGALSEAQESNKADTASLISSKLPVHDSLAAIFKKIGSKENSKEGLQELYTFKERNPEANLEPFLKKSSPFFQTYIERGLQNIEEQKKKSQSSVSSERVYGPTAEGEKDPDLVRLSDKIKYWGSKLEQQGINWHEEVDYPVLPDYGGSLSNAEVDKVWDSHAAKIDRDLAVHKKRLGMEDCSEENRFSVEGSPSRLNANAMTKSSPLEEAADVRPASSETISSSEFMDLKARLERVKRGEI